MPAGDANCIKDDSCILCGPSKNRLLGIRGNREYTGSNPETTPHLFSRVVRCRSCRFIYLNPGIAAAAELEQEHYSSAGSHTTAAHDRIKEMFESRIRLIRRFFATGTLLDVGAGKGEFVEVAIDAGFLAIGIESPPELAQAGRDKYAEDIMAGHMIVENPSSQGRFDVITLVRVLERVHKSQSLLEEIFGLHRENRFLYI